MSRNYGSRKCKRKGCGRIFNARTGNQLHCDIHKQSHKKCSTDVSEVRILMHLAASDFVNNDQRRVLVSLVAKHYS